VVTTLSITGMTCNGCVRHVQEALRTAPGVTAVEVTLADHRAIVVHDPDRSAVHVLVAVVEAAGYAASAT
jgi:copper chaperone CopZ